MFHSLLMVIHIWQRASTESCYSIMDSERMLQSSTNNVQPRASPVPLLQSLLPPPVQDDHIEVVIWCLDSTCQLDLEPDALQRALLLGISGDGFDDNLIARKAQLIPSLDCKLHDAFDSKDLSRTTDNLGQEFSVEGSPLTHRCRRYSRSHTRKLLPRFLLQPSRFLIFARSFPHCHSRQPVVDCLSSHIRIRQPVYPPVRPEYRQYSLLMRGQVEDLLRSHVSFPLCSSAGF